METNLKTSMIRLKAHLRCEQRKVHLCSTSRTSQCSTEHKNMKKLKIVTHVMLSRLVLLLLFRCERSSLLHSCISCPPLFSNSDQSCSSSIECNAEALPLAFERGGLKRSEWHAQKKLSSLFTKKINLPINRIHAAVEVQHIVIRCDGITWRQGIQGFRTGQPGPVLPDRCR